MGNIDEPRKLLGDFIEDPPWRCRTDFRANCAKARGAWLAHETSRHPETPGNLALKLNAVGSVSRHGLFFKSPRFPGQYTLA